MALIGGRIVMRTSSERTQERGMAMLVALFTIVLLSVIGLGLMYSTNMETMINSNYRDKQVATYAAISGVQEARDRLQPAAPKVTAPTDVPTLTNHQVIYVINPSGSETIEPWNDAPGNKYMDTELCQLGILGLTPTPGIPCTELPDGDDWYTVVNNTDAAWAPWNLSTPLDVKWTRIVLKANNSTPVAANGNSGVTTQTCWDGRHQLLRPAGYGPDCGPDGSIVKLEITSGGTGYTSNPTVTFSAPPAGGTLAEGTAEIGPTSTDQISSITISNPGAGYASAPTVSFVPVAGGTGATATAHIVPPGASVTSVTLTSTGEQCYLVPPPVSFVGGGSGATATATLEATPSCVVSWSVSGSCSAHRGETLTGIELSGGSGFSGTFRVSSGGRGGPSVVSGTETIQTPGTGFTTNPTSMSNLSGCGGLTVTAVAGYRLANTLNLTSGGSGYTTVPTVVVGSGTGTAAAGPTATATLGLATAGGTVSSISVNNPGSGYTAPPLVVLTGGGLSVTTPATAVANLGVTNKVSSITLTNAGLGYTYNPTVTISGGGGTGATAKASRASGSDWGRMYLVTSMSMTRSGAKAMAQTELATPVLGAWFPGAIVLDGPDPSLPALPNSNVFKVSGKDANSCSGVAQADNPAIGGYDDPEADPPTTSVQDIINAIPASRRSDTYYMGTGGTAGAPSVQNVFGSLSETFTTPAGLDSFMDDIRDDGDTHVYANNPGSVALGSAAVPTKTFVNGDLDLGGNIDGYGILAVTGKLTLHGNVHWHGIILAIGDGDIEYSGGGVLEIYGTVFDAKIWDNHTDQNLLETMGSPKFKWNGGGGNGVYYDHCWVEDLIPIVQWQPKASTKPLKILSTRTVTY